MSLRPVPTRPQPPAVDNVADQIDRIRLVMAQEIIKLLALAGARTKMHVREKKGSHLLPTLAALSVLGILDRESLVESHA